MKRTLNFFALLALGALVGCGPAGASGSDPGATAQQSIDENACGVSMGDPTVAVVRKLDFVAAKNGVAPGLNLDGRVSDASDPKGCGQPDLHDADGNAGIDNEFATLVPAIQALGGDGVTSAIQRAINNGDVLLMIGMDRVDDWQNDSCAEVELFRGKGTPAVSEQGLIESGQTFDRDPDQPSSMVKDATITDGEVTAGPVSVKIPMDVAEFHLFLSIRDATLKYTIDRDGTIHGIIAGSLVVSEMLDILNTIEDGTNLIHELRHLVQTKADLDPDASGACQRLSLAVDFEAVPAFLFADTP